MYEPLLFIHSWFRWIVLLAMVYFFARSTVGWLRNSEWAPSDGHFLWAFDQAFAYQILFGFTLWAALSPFSKIAFKDWSQIFQSPYVFFWTLRHPMTMIFSFGVFHMGRGRAKRAKSEQKNKIFSLTFGALLILVVSAIPWPWLIYGRNFFRWF